MAFAAVLPVASTLTDGSDAAAAEVIGFDACRAELIVGRNAGEGARFEVHRLGGTGWGVELGDGGSGWGPSRGVTALAVGDLDDDDDPELVVGRNGGGDGGARWEVVDHDGVGWATVMGSGGSGWGSDRSVTALTTADVDGDGEDELVIGRDGGGGARFEIVSRDGGSFDTIYADGGVTWGDSRAVVALASGDIDGDGDDEIAIGRDGTTDMRYEVLDFRDGGFGHVLIDGGIGWGPSRELTAIAMGDIDGDGDDELAIGRNEGPNMKLVVRDFVDGSWNDGVPSTDIGANATISALAFGDVDRNGREELVVGFVSPHTAGVRTYRGELDDGRMDELKLRSNVISFDESRLVLALATGDVDGDGDDDIAIGRAEGENMRFAVHSDGDAPLLDDGGSGWGESRATTAIALPDVGGDRDRDFIPDCWEVQGGVDADDDGVFEVELPLGDPDRPNLYVEIDCLVHEPDDEAPVPGGDPTHTHCPERRALRAAIDVFLRADGVAPDGSDGFHVVVDVGDLFGVGAETQWSEYDGATGLIGDFGGGNRIPENGRTIIDARSTDAFDAPVSLTDVQSEFFDEERNGIYRYGLWAHQTNFRRETDDCTGGFAVGGTDAFMVTLGGENRFGSPCYEEGDHGESYGDFDDHVGVFVHELAHKLDRGHGGHESVNYKPNYLSTMNYLYNRCEVPASPVVPGVAGGCDLSDMVMPTLDEFDLDECAGIDGGQLGYGWMDWNGDGEFQGETCQGGMIQENVTDGVDINEDRICVDDGPNDVIDSLPLGNDEFEDGRIVDGPDRICDTAAFGDDVQKRDVGHVQERYLVGSDDWSEIDLAFRVGHGEVAEDDHAIPDPFEHADVMAAIAERVGPTVELTAVGVAPVGGGTALVELTVRNTGGGPARSAVLDGKAVAKPAATGTLVATGETTATIEVDVPFWNCTGFGVVELVATTVDLFGQVDQHLRSLSFAHDNDWCGKGIVPT